MRATLDALPDLVALLDKTGCVIQVSASWRRYGRLNGAPSAHLGRSYLEASAEAARGGDRRAGRIEKGLRRLLSGEVDGFDIVHRCGDRTLRLRARSIDDGAARVIMAHEDISPLLRARRERDRAAASLLELKRQHASVMTEAHEELGQRLAAIMLATDALDRAGISNAALATIRFAVEEARRELRRLRALACDC
jgi:hypothetical protein